MPDYKQRPNICFYQHVDDCDNCYIELFENSHVIAQKNYAKKVKLFEK